MQAHTRKKQKKNGQTLTLFDIPVAHSCKTLLYAVLLWDHFCRITLVGHSCMRHATLLWDTVGHSCSSNVLGTQEWDALVDAVVTHQVRRLHLSAFQESTAIQLAKADHAGGTALCAEPPASANAGSSSSISSDRMLSNSSGSPERS